MKILDRYRTSLPAAEIAERVNEQLRRHERLIITAPPGAGKSTLLPLTMLEGWATKGKILMLEPRRLAARQIAERMASMLGEPVGKTVGYRVRFESRVSAETRIEVLTEGILTRMLVDDPTLDGVTAVVFDEFHERSLNSDVALALTRESQGVIRPDLRIVLMSATIDAEGLSQAMDAPVAESPGRMFHVELRYSPVGEDLLTQGASRLTSTDIATTVVHAIRRAHREEQGDILAFLPGEAEIRRCQELLASGEEGRESVLGSTRILPLYGMLSFAEQQRAIAPNREGVRRVVLATSIAETSLTIEGVRIVVDSGLCRQQIFDPQNGLNHLATLPVSLDMAGQRAGRAGRLEAGVCYRLWTMATEQRMQLCRQPEILDADLAPMMLDVAAWGESQPERLPWVTPPPHAHMAQARQLLRLLRATDDRGQITRHGRALGQLPCHPRIAQMLVSAQGPTQLAMAADVAAVIEEGGRSSKERTARISEQYCALAKRRRLTQATEAPSEPFTTPGQFVAAAYPERIAHAMSEGQGAFRMASGETARVEASDNLAAHEWIAIASMNAQSGRVYLAWPLDARHLTPYVQRRDNIAWDSKRGTVIAQTEQRVGCLTVQSKPLALTPEVRPAVIDTICEAAMREGTSMLDFNDAVQNVQRRVAAVAAWHPELALPDLATDTVLQRTHDWLPYYIDNGSLRTTQSELKKIDLTVALWTLLTYEQQQAVDRLAPTHIAVPTGSRIRVEYRQGAEQPILRVRLQECFGLTDTPRLDEGRRPVLMELLSPGFKPVQLTGDLRSFWQGTYFEVRKELRRRYPKHSWPDNPLEAEAVRGVRRQ